MPSSIEIDVSANIAKFKTAMDKAAIEGNKLNKKLSKAFKGIRTAMRAVGALAGVAVAGGIAAMSKKSIDAADAIQKLGVRTGASARFLSEMRLAISQSDVSAKEFSNSLIKLNKNTADAASGLSTPKRAFDALGISVEKFGKLNTDQKFTAISQAISNIEDPAKRSQIAMDLMGKSGVQLLTVMENGSKGIEDYRKKAVELNQSLSQDQVDSAAAANDAIDKLSKSISGSFTQSILNYSDEIKSMADWLTDKLPKAISATVNALSSIKDAVLPAIAAFVAVKATLFIWPTLTLAITAATASTAGFGVSAGIAAIKTGALTGSLGIMKGAMTLLGGPAGVIALVVGALALFIGRSQAAQKANSEFISSINKGTAIKLNDSLEKTSRIILNLESDLGKAKKELSEATSTFSIFGNGTFEAGMKVQQLENELRAANKASLVITKQIAEQKNTTEQLANSTSNASLATVKLTGSSIDLAKKQAIVAMQMKAVSDAADKLAVATGTNLLKTQKQLNIAVAQAEIKHANYKKALQAAHNTVINKAAPGTAEYARLMQALGFTVAKTETVTVKATTAMGKAWQKFGRDADSSLQQFFRSGLKDTKGFTESIKDSFKDMIADILSQITKLIASNAFKKLVDFLSGKSQTTKFSSGLKDLFSGGPSSSTPSGGKSPISFSSIASSVKNLFGPSGGVGKLFAPGGFFGSGGTFTTAFSTITSAAAPFVAAIASIAIGRKLADGTGKTGKFLGSVGGIAGGITARILKGLGIIGNARTPQQLAEDQLGAVDQATKEGRNEQVALGQAAGTSVSFLGGFDEFSTFFGIDKAKDDIQKIGDIFKANFGGDALLAVKDGILRIEDKSRKFSENNKEIVAQVKASIIEFELQFTKTEKSILASLGSSISGVDELFDSMKDSGLSASEKLIRSYSQFFNKTKAEGEQWLASSGVQADRWAQIFNNASGPVLSQLVGLGDAGVQSFNDIANSAQGLSSDMIGLNDVLLETARRQSNIVPIGGNANGQGGNQASGESNDSSNRSASTAQNDALIIELRQAVAALSENSKQQTDLTRQIRNQGQ